jgi:hypothetical protein
MFRKIDFCFNVLFLILLINNVVGQTEIKKAENDIGIGLKLYRPLFFSRDVIFTLNHTYNHKNKNYFIIQRFGYMPEVRSGHYSHLRLIESGKSFSYQLIYNHYFFKKGWFNAYILGGVGLIYNNNNSPNYPELEKSFSRQAEIGIGLKKDFNKFSVNIPFTIENVRNTKEENGLLRVINSYLILSYKI